MPNFTKRAIKESFWELLNEKQLNRISVKDIVERCGISRNSFYYHFQDIPALIEEIVTDLFDNLIKQYPEVTHIDQCFSTAVRFMLENKKVLLHIYNSVNRDIYERYLMQFCEYVVTSYLETAFDIMLNEEDRKIIIRFFKCMLFGSYMDWASSGMPESAIDEMMRLLTLLRETPQEILDKCRGEI